MFTDERVAMVEVVGVASSGTGRDVQMYVSTVGKRRQCGTRATFNEVDWVRVQDGKAREQENDLLVR